MNQENVIILKKEPNEYGMSVINGPINEIQKESFEIKLINVSYYFKNDHSKKIHQINVIDNLSDNEIIECILKESKNI